MHAIRGLDNKESLMQASVCLCGARAHQRERERGKDTYGGENIIGMCNVEKEEEEEWTGERNAHNAVISVFDLPISLWGYYVGTLSLPISLFLSLSLGVYVGYMYAGEGRPVLFHPHYYSVGRSRADSSRGEARGLRLFMDGFSFNFRQGSLGLALSLFAVPSLAFRVFTHRCDIEKLTISEKN